MPTPTTHHPPKILGAMQTVLSRQHLNKRPLGGELLATLAATRGENGTASAGAHPSTETVHLGATAVVGLKSALAHESNPRGMRVRPTETVQMSTPQDTTIPATRSNGPQRYPQVEGFSHTRCQDFTNPNRVRIRLSTGRRRTMSDPNDDVDGFWSGIVSQLATDNRITPQLRGFLDLVQPRGVLSGVLYLEVPNELTRGMLEQRVRIPLMAAMETIEGNEVKNFALVVNPDIDQAPLASPSPAHPSPFDTTTELPPHTEPISIGPQARLNDKYTFDSFVIGPSNRFSHAAAVAVAEAPAKAYNPLFIYGGSGLGKTHLLHAIGHYTQNLYKGVRVKYVSSEEFTNDFINAIANNRSHEFQNRYREVDVLLIDDIQFLQGKDSTQEAFFHTFNTLHDHNKQVVVTSDMPPKQLTGFEDRMRTRFEWGLITDVQAPDLETRIAILRKKAASDNLAIDDDVLEFMASRVSTNIRELEGALIRVTAFANLNRSDITMNLVHTVMKDLMLSEEANIIAPTEIISQTAQYFDLTVEDLYGSSRSQTIAMARQIAMYLCREMTSLSLPKIGQLFGNRDHTTVMYANKKISDLMKERRSVYNQVTELTSRIKRQYAY